MTVLLLASQAIWLLGQPECVPGRKEIREAEKRFGEQVILQPVPLLDQQEALAGILHPGDCVFRMTGSSGRTGYLLSTRAPGRFDAFDYAILYNDSLVVEGVVVTRYRSDHGGAIAHPRWLSQFHGYRGGPLHLGKDIDGVSGGTISASSMVADMQRCHRLMSALILH